MTHSYEIQIVLKDRSQKPAHQPTHIGGRISGGIGWKIPVKEAVENIRDGRAKYYVLKDDGGKAFVKVMNQSFGAPYLTVGEERSEPKTLLALPEVLD